MRTLLARLLRALADLVDPTQGACSACGQWCEYAGGRAYAVTTPHGRRLLVRMQLCLTCLFQNRPQAAPKPQAPTGRLAPRSASRGHTR